jgi:hypothetical protein
LNAGRRAQNDGEQTLAPLLRLGQILDFATSPYTGERVAAAIALGVYASDSMHAREDAQVVSALRGLLTDHFSRVRYRAVEAVADCPELIEGLQPELRRLADSDTNKSVKNLARKVLA